MNATAPRLIRGRCPYPDQSGAFDAAGRNLPRAAASSIRIPRKCVGEMAKRLQLSRLCHGTSLAGRIMVNGERLSRPGGIHG